MPASQLLARQPDRPSGPGPHRSPPRRCVGTARRRRFSAPRAAAVFGAPWHALRRVSPGFRRRDGMRSGLARVLALVASANGVEDTPLAAAVRTDAAWFRHCCGNA